MNLLTARETLFSTPSKYLLRVTCYGMIITWFCALGLALLLQ